ncbi:uncharacterized protein [Diabrotica undecimpunctata]|uniref:uncharacterized protein n=1 Tax=Diabrotica undecimpunctata TaxID=50387 RepID=UPI003B637414
MVCCASAAGQSVPLMIIFKKKCSQKELSLGALPSNIVTISDTGYISSDLFVTWLDHFVEIVKPNPKDPVLLLLDDHSTHSKNLKALQIAGDNTVRLLQLSSHTTHILQPLDVGFFRALQNVYGQCIKKMVKK